MKILNTYFLVEMSIGEHGYGKSWKTLLQTEDEALNYVKAEYSQHILNDEGSYSRSKDLKFNYKISEINLLKNDQLL